MRVPTSTYRIQFHQGFRFVDARDLVPYLHDLGISDLYSSPWFKARRGSSHGYDIADPSRFNSELGTEEEFWEMSERLRHYEMGLLLDMVPNHMAASGENPWWMDLLENGPASEYGSFFDIDWSPPTGKAAFLSRNRVLLPIIGDLYGNVLCKQELSLRIDDTGLWARYYDTKLPIDPKTYDAVLERALEENPNAVGLRRILQEIERLPDRNTASGDQLPVRRAMKTAIKNHLWKAYLSDPEVKSGIDAALLRFNGNREDGRSFDSLDALLSRQAYRIAHWKIGYEEINYRRFFDVNELVGLRVEVPEVFDVRHRKALELIRAGAVTALRIDHVDGLYDPAGYLERLQAAIGASGGFYIVVEKILGRREHLPPEWPVSGTTGYEFLNALNGVFVHPLGLAALDDVYARRTGVTAPFADISYAANKQVMQQLFPGEVIALGRALAVLAAHDREARDVPVSELTEALVEVTACLPVYRTYMRSFEIDAQDRGYIERTLETARARCPDERVGNAAFAFLRRVLLLDPPYYAADRRDDYLRFVMRWQQFTGPVMAKGLEDTASYRYNSLLSMNEVGGDPERVEGPPDLAAFHEFNRARQRQWPHTLNATSTHDTKRGEDVRARLNVLTELPREWERHLDCWRGLAPGPGHNEEFLVYQTLLGTYPGDESEMAAYPERVAQFVVKAAREAKLGTSWIRPDAGYERALTDFVAALLDENGKFLDAFRPFQRKVAHFGAINGLSQALVKITAPGVPDFYQGCELWNFSMVDPDNRRPVDYRKRIDLLDMLRRRESDDRTRLAAELGGDPGQDAAKLYVTSKALAFRREHAALFAGGEYVALETAGAHAENICAFVRCLDRQWALVAVPRWLTQVTDWGDTTVLRPPGAAEAWTNIFTGARGALGAAELFRDFPVALLEAS